MTKLELIQSIIKHRQPGAGKCVCSLATANGPPKVEDVARDCSYGVRPPSASHDDVRQG